MIENSKNKHDIGNANLGQFNTSPNPNPNLNLTGANQGQISSHFQGNQSQQLNSEELFSKLLQSKDQGSIQGSFQESVQGSVQGSVQVNQITQNVQGAQGTPSNIQVNQGTTGGIISGPSLLQDMQTTNQKNNNKEQDNLLNTSNITNTNLSNLDVATNKEHQSLHNSDIKTNEEGEIKKEKRGEIDYIADVTNNQLKDVCLIL